MSVDFIQTLADPKQIPDLFNGDFLKGRRESRLIMVGRSNVGKSSLINAGLIPKLKDRFDIWGPTRVNSQPALTVQNRYVWSAISGFSIR